MKGVNALASRLGKPLVTDSVTANKCKQGIGMVRYARVLIEVSAKKTLANDVEIVYKNTEGMVQYRKTIKVEYDWKPPMCSEYGVFGHTDSICYMNVENINTNTELLKKNAKEKVNAVNNDQIKPNVQKDKSSQIKDNDDGFVEVKRKKNIGIDNKSIDMIAYHKQKSKELVYKAKKANTEVEDNSEMGDVLEEIGGIAKCMEENVVKGMEEEVLGDCWSFIKLFNGF
nr:hypothetical protein [Tanacetum cinerariifolium]